jgi:hypothetical protein
MELRVYFGCPPEFEDEELALDEAPEFDELELGGL